jgi:hypothetical protein
MLRRIVLAAAFVVPLAAVAAGPETVAIGSAHFSEPVYGRECDGVANVAMDSQTNSGSFTWIDGDGKECSNIQNTYYPGECRRAPDGTVSCSASYNDFFCRESTTLTLSPNGGLRWVYTCPFLGLFDITTTITGRLTRL